MDATEFFTATLPNLLAGLFQHPITGQAIILSLLLSVAGTVLILKHIGFRFWFDGIPYFCGLFIGSCLAHAMLGELPLPGLAPLAQLLVTSLIGMTVGTLTLMSLIKPEVR